MQAKKPARNLRREMNKLVIINQNVPMCQECGGGIKMNTQTHSYRCMHCGKVYKIVDIGKNDREFVCETRVDFVEK